MKIIKRNIGKKAKQFKRYLKPYLQSGMRRNLRAATVYWPMLIAVLFIGLESKSERATQWPAFIQLFAGSVLWAFFIYLAMSIYRPRAKITKIAIYSAITLVVIELVKVLFTIFNIMPVQHLNLNLQTFITVVCFAGGIFLGVITDKINFHVRLKSESGTAHSTKALKN